MGLGDIPYIKFGDQEDYKRLYHSNPEAALKVDITVQAGYGKLKIGTILAQNASAAGGVGKFVPYNPTTFTGAEDHPGRAYLVASSGVTDDFVYVTLDDARKFVVGDDLIINDDTTTVENLGAITEIDVTSEVHRAKITFTTAIGGTAFTTARKAYVCIEAGADNSNNYSDAVGVLEKTVNAGVGEDSKGALATLIVSNALLHTGMLVNYDGAALADLGSSAIGRFTKLP